MSDEKGWPVKPSMGLDGMLVEVRKLRLRGVRISKEEMDEMVPLVGMAKSEDVVPTAGMIPYRQVLNPYRQDGTPGSVSTPLFEPRCEKLNSMGLVLSGSEIIAEEGVATPARPGLASYANFVDAVGCASNLGSEIL